MSSIPAVPLDCIDALRVMEGDLDGAMVKVSHQKGAKKVSMSNIADYFFRQCGIPTTEWNFCDSLFVRYFTKVPPNLYVGKEFACHAACLVMCICIADSRLLTRLAIEAYADGEDGSYITLGRTRLLIQNLLDVRGGNCEL